MSMYSEPGRGRKQCPSCQIYVHVRNSKCEKCSHVFFEKKGIYKKKSGEAKLKKVIQPVEPAKVFEEGGKGKKQCPECEKYMGARVAICPNCEFSFKAAKSAANPEFKKIKEFKKENEIARQNASSLLWDDNCISTPSGPCPIKLNEINEEGVREWADSLKTYGRIRDITYADSAVNYWLREFVDIHSDEYRELSSVVLGEDE